MGNETFSFISSFALCACVCSSVFVYACAQALGTDVRFRVSAQLGGGEHQRLCILVHWCAPGYGGGDTGIFSHGLSHKFECIYLFSSVDVLGCVRLHRGTYLHKTISTRRRFACHLGGVCARTVGVCVGGVSTAIQEGEWVRCTLPPGVDYSACVPPICCRAACLHDFAL